MAALDEDKANLSGKFVSFRLKLTEETAWIPSTRKKIPLTYFSKIRGVGNFQNVGKVGSIKKFPLQSETG